MCVVAMEEREIQKCLQCPAYITPQKTIRLSATFYTTHSLPTQTFAESTNIPNHCRYSSAKNESSCHHCVACMLYKMTNFFISHDYSASLVGHKRPSLICYNIDSEFWLSEPSWLSVFWDVVFFYTFAYTNAVTHTYMHSDHKK